LDECWGSKSSASKSASESNKFVDALAFDALVLALKLRALMMEDWVVQYPDQV